MLLAQSARARAVEYANWISAEEYNSPDKCPRYDTYRTLHSYKLFWAVCHLFPQRWRTLNVQSRETIGQEDHVICLQLRRRA